MLLRKPLLKHQLLPHFCLWPGLRLRSVLCWGTQTSCAHLCQEIFELVKPQLPP